MNKVGIDDAAQLFGSGKIGIFPTDTAFGIGCVIDNVEAVEKLFKIRNRPTNKPTPVLVNSVGMVEKITQNSLDEDVKKIIHNYWPGGLTVVVSNNNDAIPDLVRGGTKTLGVRMPNHEGMLEIIKKVGKPILAPSANFGGGQTPFSLDEVEQDLIDLADFVVEGECLGNKSSTVLDCTQKPYKILRQGAVMIEPMLL